MAGIGGTNMENRGIEYRERSPLVVPPKLDLPPPASAATEVKHAELAEGPRCAAPQGRDRGPQEGQQGSPGSRPHPDAGRTGRRQAAGPARTNNDPIQPGTSNNNPILSPSQLGYTGGLSGLFSSNKSETAPFKGEPTRESLTQPPSGYQTPSPNFAYGTGPRESLNKEYNPAAGKYGE